MKKKMKIMGAFLLTTIFSLGLLSACKIGTTYYESGDFVYYLMEESKVFLGGLSESGKEKDLIIVPETIDGKPVINLSRSFWGDHEGQLESTNLKTLYIKGTPTCRAMSTFDGCPNLNKLVMLKTEIENEILVDYVEEAVNFNLYVCSSISLSYSAIYKVYWANISYQYNYEGAENEGYYWVDNFNYGEKIGYIPENPEREGYKFGGWYKEAECENVWNFDKDTLPEATHNEEGEELYQETRLYAKWYKN